MKILAIWDRHKAEPNSKSIFVLTDDERFLSISPVEIFIGTDAEGKKLYKDNGNMEMFDAYKEGEKFDFDKADYYIRHFGGELLVRWS